MDKKNLGYSKKNIPIASKKAYMKKMMEKVESFVRRLRWKALFFEKPELAGGNKKETYGFKTNLAPPRMEHLNAFEADLYDLACNIQFSPRRDAFQRKLATDVKEINNSPNVLVSADKTTNLYSMSKEAYVKLLGENVTKTYKKADATTKSEIDCEAKDIAISLELADRMEVYAEKDAFITLKDHKEDFRTRPSCRLINPAKSEMGIVCKQKVEKINARVRVALSLQQWRSTGEVVNWFKSLPNTRGMKFVKFDIVEFYPSISEQLLARVITWAKTVTTISQEDEAVIWHSRKSLLFSGNSAWVKTSGDDFDVTMGSFDGAEICELVGLYILNLLSEKCSKSRIGLYRDDGLAALKLTGPQADRTRKEIVEVFQSCDLRVTVETNLEQTDFLDVTFDLPTRKFWPFRKPNSDPLYVNAKSNHPPTVIKQLPAGITRRLASLSCNEEEFRKAKPAYEEALRSAGHKDVHMEYEENEEAQGRARRRRTRDVIWFNPPYNQNVTTDIAKQTLKLLDKHFPKHHRYHKIFNRNKVKVSYSCMNNMAAVISGHNAKVLAPAVDAAATRKCNCSARANCPLRGECLTECVVYRATVSAPSHPTRVYYGLTEGPFKTRYNAHVRSFRKEELRTETALSKHLWDLKAQGVAAPAVRWDVEQRAAPYKCGTRRCDVCLAEKMVIALADPTTMLNSRSEIVSTCRHRAKFRLDKVVNRNRPAAPPGAPT